MKSLHLLLILVLTAFPISMHAQGNENGILNETPVGTYRVYAELSATPADSWGFKFDHKAEIIIDLGQHRKFLKSYYLVNEKGKTIKFNGTIDALNYMGKRGWKLFQTYITRSGDTDVSHWLMYKDVSDDKEIYEGIMVKNTDSDPKKKNKEKDEATETEE